MIKLRLLRRAKERKITKRRSDGEADNDGN